MSIVAADIEYRYSGGAGNTSAAASLGGAISTAAGGTIDDAVKNDLWDDVSSAEAATGDTEYRGFYVKNAHGSLALTTARVFISSATIASGDEFDIGVAVEDVNVTMATIANESTAPTSVTFSRPTTYSGGLDLNTGTPANGLPAGQARGVWIRRTVSVGAAAQANNTGTVAVQGDTL